MINPNKQKINKMYNSKTTIIELPLTVQQLPRVIMLKVNFDFKNFTGDVDEDILHAEPQ